MEERDDYPIIPQGEEDQKKSIIKFLLGEDSYDGYWWGDDFTGQREKYWWRTKLRKELASLKEENAKLKESIKELLPIVEFFTVSHLKEGEIWMNRDEVINRAKRISDNK